METVHCDKKCANLSILFPCESQLFGTPFILSERGEDIYKSYEKNETFGKVIYLESVSIKL